MTLAGHTAFASSGPPDRADVLHPALARLQPAITWCQHYSEHGRWPVEVSKTASILPATARKAAPDAE